MVQKEVLEKEGLVIEALPNATFRVRFSDEKLVLCHVAGKMRINRIRIMPGDRVRVELTPYDATKGRIVYRLRQ